MSHVYSGFEFAVLDDFPDKKGCPVFGQPFELKHPIFDFFFLAPVACE